MTRGRKSTLPAQLLELLRVGPQPVTALATQTHRPRASIKRTLCHMQQQGWVHSRGRSVGARWYLGPLPPGQAKAVRRPASVPRIRRVVVVPAPIRQPKRVQRSPWETSRENFTAAMRARAFEANNSKEGQRINGLSGLK